MKRITGARLKERLQEIADLEITEGESRVVKDLRQTLVSEVGSARELVGLAAALPPPFGGARSSPPLPHWVLKYAGYEMEDEGKRLGHDKDFQP